MRKDMENDAAEMLEAAGFKNVRDATTATIGAGPRHPRDGHRAHGHATRRPRCSTPSTRCTRARTSMSPTARHGLGVLREPLADLHGADRAGGRPCGRRAQADEHLMRRQPHESSRADPARGVADGRRDFRACSARRAQRLLAEAGRELESARSSATRGRDRRRRRRPDPAAHRHAGRARRRRAGVHRCRSSRTRIRPTTRRVSSAG